MADLPPPTLLVCTTCRAGRELAEGETPPGQRLHDAIAGALEAAGDAAPALRLRGVACMATCQRGCAAAISQPGKWTYLLGDLSADLAPDLLTYAAAYAAHGSGALLPSRRPASLRSVVLARLPADLPPPEQESAA